MRARSGVRPSILSSESGGQYPGDILRYRLTFLALSSLAVACGALSSSDATPSADRLRSAAPTATAPAATTPEPASTTPIDYVDFCSQAEFTPVDRNLPAVLTDSLQDGTITLRYRLPPGAEPLLIWMGVPIEPESVTSGELIASNAALAALFPNAGSRGALPSIASNAALAALFPNADRGARFPSTITSDGFDLEIDGQVHVIAVHILLPTELGYDSGNEWRWSDFTDPPFGVGEPIVAARFRADGVRVDLDGTHCTPRIIPLP